MVTQEQQSSIVFKAASFLLAASLLIPLDAWAALTVMPLTWNIIGLDSNDPLTGPNDFPVGARVCSDIDTTNVDVSLNFVSANAFINTRPGSLNTLNFASISGGNCVDAYFEVEVTRNPAAFDTTRAYRIDAVDATGTYSSPTPRELYVEHLVSQNRNSVTGIRYGSDPGNLTAVPPGGSLNLVVGNTYTIELTGGTATQGYEQIEAFINFTNTIFQILSVSTTYSADTSPFVSSPNSMLYGDACLWENDPNSPNYRACLDTGKVGGSNVVTLYTIRIISGGGSSQALNTLFYDFSGSSFHYNADFSFGAVIGNVIDPATANISKSFTPSTIPQGGTATLTITLSNPNPGALSGYNFVDNLPAGMTVASPPNATTNACGTPVFSPLPGESSLSFTDGTVGAGSFCTLSVSVVTSGTGTFDNTTDNLFVDTVDTGHTGSATLTVNNAPPPPPGICGQPLASWLFPTGFNVNAPVASSSSVTASAAPGSGLVPNTQTSLTSDGTIAWGSNGSITTGAALNTANNEYFQFTLDTTGVTEVTLSFNAQRRSANGPQGLALIYGQSGTETTDFNNATALSSLNTTVAFSRTLSTGINSSGNTIFRIYSFNAGNSNPGADPVLDDVVFTGCIQGQPPTLVKSFSPNPIAVGDFATLVFTLSNPNFVALTGAAFSDSFPAGMTVAAPLTVANTCGGSLIASAGVSTVSLSGGVIPANGSCMVSVDITTSVVGPSTNTSDFLSTTETGINIGPGGSASATLLTLAAPVIDKQFGPNPILANGTSRLTFTITNPNQNDLIDGVSFSDVFPNSPGGMTVATPPAESTSGCGSPTFAPTAGATSISFSGGTIAAGAVCIVTVNVTAPVDGSYINTSGNVSHIINGVAETGNTANDVLTVVPPSPAVGLLKQVGATATGNWLSYLALPPGNDVFYLLTVENLGDVPLSGVLVNDPLLNTSTCVWPDPLPVADANSDNHIATCVVGPVIAIAGVNPNTATAAGNFGAGLVQDTDSATYATTGLALIKSANPTTFTNSGETINYNFSVTNSGFAILSGPVTINDDITTNETCPALDTIGNNDNFFNPGEQIVCTASYVTTTTDESNGLVLNTASALTPAAISPTDSVSVPRAGTVVDLTISKNDGGASVLPGATIVYTLTVTNLGDQNATAATISETVPANTTFDPTMSSAGWFCTPNGNAGSTCTLQIGTLGNNGTAISVNFAVIVDPAVVGVPSIPNTAIVSDPADVDTNNNSASISTPVSGVPDLTISKGDGGVYAASGAVVTYTLNYSNVGNQNSSGVVLTETVPLYTTFNPGASTAGWACVPDNNAGSSCTLAIGTVAASSGGSATFAVTVDDPLPLNVTELSNTATIADDGTNGPDPNPGNNSGSVTTAAGTANSNPGSTQSIPVNAPWMLLTMALSLLAAVRRTYRD
ncbi:MAG: beta strand repeat-containing protein [Gammaproteobacteria bacterium]